MRVVVVGAGISGAATTDAIRRRRGNADDLIVLERASRIGGRVQDRLIAGRRLDTGATLYHSSNRLFSGYVDELGLTARNISTEGRARRLGIWDGRRLVFQTRGSRLDSARVFARYRRSLLRAARQVKGMIAGLQRAYPALAAGRSWPSPTDLLTEIGLIDLGRQYAADLFTRHGIGARFATEFADAVSRNNYGQVARELNAFVDLVSLAGAGLGGGSLHRVREGNARVCERLVERSGADVRLNATLTELRPRGGGWGLRLEDGADLDADAVVLAAPLELTDIELVGTEAPQPRTYKKIHTTFAVGQVEHGYFAGEPAPDMVLTTAGAGPLLSLEEVAAEAEGGAVYKVFSSAALDDAFIARLFGKPAHVERIVWDAYPELPPGLRAPGFRLAERLYYASALEYYVSTMETQAIAGVATANLLVGELG